VLIPLAFGLVLAGGPSVPAGRAVQTPALSAPARPRTPGWARPAASIAPVLYRARFSRRAGVSRVERGVTSSGPRTTVTPHTAGTLLAGIGEGRGRSHRAEATFERGPPSLS